IAHLLAKRSRAMTSIDRYDRRNQYFVSVEAGRQHPESMELRKHQSQLTFDAKRLVTPLRMPIKQNRPMMLALPSSRAQKASRLQPAIATDQLDSSCASSPETVQVLTTRSIE